MSHGYFDDRFIDMCKRKGLNVDVLSSEWEKIVLVKDMKKAVKALGFEILAEEGNRAVTLSNFIYSEGVDDGEFREILAEEGTVVAAGLGEYAGKLFRLGHMGNIDKHILLSTIAAIERASKKSGMDIELGSGLRVLQEGIL